MRLLLKIVAGLVSLTGTTVAASLDAGQAITFSEVTGFNDQLYKIPFVDIDEQRSSPLPHRFVHGGFNGTELRFSFYFPPKEIYKSRFLQALPAVTGREDVLLQPVTLGAVIADVVPFAFSEGAYAVESNQGSFGMFPGRNGGRNGMIPEYRASAAAAEFARYLAMEMYGGGRPFGYVFGGSGGGYKTISCLENSETWDGGVPFIIGSSASIPNVFTIQAHAMRILEGKFPQIVDALEPGGSGDMFAGLNVEEREALAEVTKMGFPPQAWFRIEKIAAGYTGVFSSLIEIVKMMDPMYFKDFWIAKGYLGATPTESLLKARINMKTTIKRVIMTNEAIAMGLPVSLSGKFGAGLNESPAALELASLPTTNAMGANVQLMSGGSKGLNMMISATRGNLAVVGFGGSPANLDKMKAGDEVEVDNNVYLASQTYHRHQYPGPEYAVWDQFRIGGKPIYPQRKIEMSKMPLQGSATTQSGKFKAKVIVVEALWDEAAYPWQADWYRGRVKKNLGGNDESQFRLYMVDKAMHTSAQEPLANETRPVEITRIVNYTPVIQQALRDVIAWTERGIAPPPGTRYSISDGQVVVPLTATKRKGIQPVVNFYVNGKSRADVRAGELVQFNGTVGIPPGRGKVLDALVDFEGDGTFGTKGELLLEGDYTATVTTSHVFSKPGIYFATLKGIAQAGSDLQSPFGRVYDLGRVRVVVS